MSENKAYKASINWESVKGTRVLACKPGRSETEARQALSLYLASAIDLGAGRLGPMHGY